MAEIFSSNWENITILDGGTWDSEQGTTGALSVATDQFFQGSQALKFNRNDITTNYVQKAISSTSVLGVRIATRINTIGSTEVGSVNALTGATSVYSLALFPTEIGVLNVNTFAYVGSNFTFTADIWYQIEIRFIAGTSITWKIWNAEGTSLVHTEQTDTVSVNPGSVDSIIVGAPYVESSASNIYWFDAFSADNANYTGPYILRAVNYLTV